MDELQYINELQSEHAKVHRELHSVKTRAVAKIKALQAEVARLNSQLKQQSQDDAPARQHDDSSASDASAASDASDFVKVRSCSVPVPAAASTLQQCEEALRLRETALKELEVSLREREAAAAEREDAATQRELDLKQHELESELEAASLRDALLEGLLQIRHNLAPVLA